MNLRDNAQEAIDQITEVGMKHFFVEHDSPAKPFESIASSIGYLKKNV